MSMILSPRDTDKIHDIAVEFGTLTPRELELVIAAIAAGKDIKADEIQPTLTNLELSLADARAIPIT
jgi:hypothetical protein